MGSLQGEGLVASKLLAPKLLLQGPAGPVGWVLPVTREAGGAGERVVSVGRLGDLRAWDTHSGECMASGCLPPRCCVTAAAVADGGALVALGGMFAKAEGPGEPRLCHGQGQVFVALWDPWEGALVGAEVHPLSFFGGPPSVHATTAPGPALLLSGPSQSFRRWTLSRGRWEEAMKQEGRDELFRGTGGAGMATGVIYAALASNSLAEGAGTEPQSSSLGRAGRTLAGWRSVMADGEIMVAADTASWSVWTTESFDSRTGCYNVPLLSERPAEGAISGCLALARPEPNRCITAVRTEAGGGHVFEVDLGGPKEGCARVLREQTFECRPDSAWAPDEGGALCLLQAGSYGGGEGGRAAAEVVLVEPFTGNDGAGEGSPQRKDPRAPVSVIGRLDEVTEEPCQTLVFADCLYPKYCVQGRRDGSLRVANAAHVFASIGTCSEPAYCTDEATAAHSGPVNCICESKRHGQAPDSGTPECVVISGGGDGALVTWALQNGKLKILRRILAHNGPVQRLWRAPVGTARPWDNCVVSLGADGLICLFCTDEERVVRTFPGHGQEVVDLRWDSDRGFLAVLRLERGALPCVVVWDARSGSRDRAVEGAPALGLWADFPPSSSSSSGGAEWQWQGSPIADSKAALPRGGGSGVAGLPTRPFVASGRSASLCLFSVDVAPLVNPQRDFAPPLEEEALLASVIAALHFYGCCEAVDSTVRGTIFGLIPSAATPAADTPFSEPGRVSVAAVSEGGEVAVAWPDSSSCNLLWERNPTFVAKRLLSLVAVVETLMRKTRDPACLNACGNLLAFYASRFHDLVPNLAQPDLAIFAAQGQSSTESLREASYTLLRSGANMVSPQQAALVVRRVSNAIASSHQRLGGSRHQVQLIVAGLLSTKDSDGSCLMEDMGRIISALCTLACELDAAFSASACRVLSEGLRSEPWARWKVESPRSEFRALLDMLLESTREKVTPGSKAASSSAAASSPILAAFLSSESSLPSPETSNFNSLALNTSPKKPSKRSRLAKQQLSDVLVAAASLDFKMFLKCLGKQMTDLHAQSGVVTSETLSLMIVLRVIQTMPMAVLENLQLAVMVILCAVDPVRQDLRKQSIQSVLMISQGLSQQFPVVDFDSKSMWLAVGHHSSDAGLKSDDEQELVSVYDLNSSAKVRILRAWEQGHDLEARDSATAIKFSPDMESLAAFFEAAGCIRIWSLKEGWQQRFSRQTSTMAPVKMLFVDIPEDSSHGPRRNSQSPQMGGQKRHFTSVRKLPYTLQWLASGQIELLLRGERLQIINF